MNDQSTAAVDVDATAITNLAVLRGCVRGEPVIRVLPSQRMVLQFDLTTTIIGDGRRSTISVPVAWADPGAAASALVTDGVELVVIGSVRRRFFRVGGATQSRTEVVAESAIPARRRKQVAAALDRVVDRLAIT
jgi:single-strand DNA-binding protein